MSAVRCDLCGKFRKVEDVSTTADDYEEWVECIKCMPGSDLERHLKAKEMAQ